MKSINNKLFLVWPILVAILLVGNSSQAQTKFTFPVSELGGCADTKSCKAYCDQLEHVDACVSFAKDHGLITAAQADQTQKFAAIRVGPGGCTTKDACQTYCSDKTHIDECLKFAKEHKLVSDDQIQAMEKFKTALAQDNTPGSCSDENSCKIYCQDSSHQAQCLKWAQTHGLIQPEEAKKIQKFQEFITNSQTPGGCTTKDACQTYCSDKTHFDECLAFGQKMGLVNQQQADAKKKEGTKGPGGCDSRDACEQFCNDPQNTQTCIDFAKQRGIVTPIQPKKDQNLQTPIPAPKPSEKPTPIVITLPPALRDCVIKMYGPAFLDLLQKGQLGTTDFKTRIPECVKQPEPAVPKPTTENPKKILPREPFASEPFKSN